MKRIEAACVCQTLRFSAKEGMSRKYAAETIRSEIEYYKKKLEASRTAYKIVEQIEQPDGSVIVKVMKQYNYNPVGDYLK